MKSSSFVIDEHEVSVKEKGSHSKILWVILFILGAALIAAVIIVIGLAAGLGVERASNAAASSSAAGVCTTPTCVELGSQILESLDESIDPCDDFYKFSCNGFIEEAIIPFGVGSIGAFETLRTINVERIRELMESGDDMGLDSINRAITYYQSCLTGDNFETSLQTLHDFLRGLGGWPLVGLDLGTEWTMNNREGYVLEAVYGTGAFFGVDFCTDPTNSSRNIICVLQSGLTVSAQVVYINPDVRAIIEQVMMDVLTLVNSSIPSSTYRQAISDILDFETSIANFYDFDTTGRLYNELYSVTSYQELSETLPQFDWLQNIQYFGSLGNVTIDETAPVGFLGPRNYLRSMGTLIQNTSSEVLENYSKWHAILGLLPSMSREFSDIFFDLRKLLTGDEEPPRYRSCVNGVESRLRHSIARAFTEVYLPQGARESLMLVLTELESSLRLRINSMDWLDQPTKQRAVNKLNTVTELVAYPDIILNNTFLDGYYSALDVSSNNSFLMNSLNARLFDRIQCFRLVDIALTNNRSEWFLSLPSTTITNAFYAFNFNQIYIFGGIIETPFYRTYWPFYFKFATMGFVIGHEYTHGFDNQGRQFNEIGNLEMWWSTDSVNEFNSRTQCFVDQYSNYSLPVGPVNGTRTLGENIADNGGLATSYMAYKNYVERMGIVEQRLPGLSYTPDQLFFIGTTQLWCNVATEQAQGSSLNGVHSPRSIRPIGYLSNSPEFAAAFNCPLGSPMNPEKKCEIW